MSRIHFIFILIIVITAISCGSKQSDSLSLSDIKEPCDCSNHLNIYLDEAIVIAKNYDSGKDIEGSADESELEFLLDRIEATQSKCEKKFEMSALQACGASDEIESKLMELYSLLTN